MYYLSVGIMARLLEFKPSSFLALNKNLVFYSETVKVKQMATPFPSG